MSDAIITTIISSLCVLIGSIITVVMTNSKTRAIATLEQEHIREQIRILSDRVDEHNNYAIEIPLIKQDIGYIKERISNG